MVSFLSSLSVSLAHWCWSVVMYWDGYQERCYTDCWLSRRVRKAAKASFLRLLPVYSYASVMRKKETNKKINTSHLGTQTIGAIQQRSAERG